jgi:hypothetical protein
MRLNDIPTSVLGTYAYHSLMELSPSWEDANCAATQELPSILCNPKVQYRIHKSPPLVPILSQISPPHHISLRSNLILSSHLQAFLLVSFLPAFAPKSYIQSSSPHACYVNCPSHPPWLDYSNYTWRRVKVMKLLIMQFSQTSRHFISLRPKYSSQRPVLKHPQSMFLT